MQNDLAPVHSLVFGVIAGYTMPSRLWVIVLSMESQRVGLLRNFLRYLSHEVRVPANVSLLAIDDVKACLAALQASTWSPMKPLVSLQNAQLALPSAALGTDEWKAKPFGSIADAAAAESKACAATSAGSALIVAIPSRPHSPLTPLRLPSHNGCFGVAASPTSPGCGSDRNGSPFPPGTPAADLQYTSGDSPLAHRVRQDTSCSASSSFPARQMTDEVGPTNEQLYGSPSMPREPQRPMEASAQVSIIQAALQSADDVLMSLTSMKDLLDRTLDLARFDAGVHRLRMEVFDLRDLLRRVHREASQVFRGTGVELVWEPFRASSPKGGSKAGRPPVYRTRSTGGGAKQSDSDDGASTSTGTGPSHTTGGTYTSGLVSLLAGQDTDDENAPPLWIRGDPLQLRQSMINILHNGSKFTPAGKSVTVSIHLEQVTHRRVVLAADEEKVADLNTIAEEAALIDGEGAGGLCCSPASWFAGRTRQGTISESPAIAAATPPTLDDVPGTDSPMNPSSQSRALGKSQRRTANADGAGQASLASNPAMSMSGGGSRGVRSASAGGQKALSPSISTTAVPMSTLMSGPRCVAFMGSSGLSDGEGGGGKLQARLVSMMRVTNAAKGDPRQHHRGVASTTALRRGGIWLAHWGGALGNGTRQG